MAACHVSDSCTSPCAADVFLSDVHVACLNEGPTRSCFTISLTRGCSLDDNGNEESDDSQGDTCEGYVAVSQRGSDNGSKEKKTSKEFLLSENSGRKRTSELQVDDHGDLILPRRNKKTFLREKDQEMKESSSREIKQAIVIYHSMATPLPLVGLQVWRGALLLADFILHESGRWQGITALELGAGTGLVGIITALFGARVFITDIGKEVLDNCVRNVKANEKTFFGFGNCKKNPVKVRWVDWRNPWPPNFKSNFLSSSNKKDDNRLKNNSLFFSNKNNDSCLEKKKKNYESTSQKQMEVEGEGEGEGQRERGGEGQREREGEGEGEGEEGQQERGGGEGEARREREGEGEFGMYEWTKEDVEEVSKLNVIFAADVVYSEDLTESFFKILREMMPIGLNKVLYISLEKRYNFTMQDCDIVATGYKHFRSFFKEIRSEFKEESFDEKVDFVGKLIPWSTIPQFMETYERGEDLELWEIQRCTKRQIK